MRFGGLTGLTPDAPRLKTIQRRIRGLLGDMLATLLETTDEQAGYARWRELTAPLVERAKAAFAESVPDLPSPVDVETAVKACWADARRFGPHDGIDPSGVTDLVLCFDDNLIWPAAVLLESVLANASGPVRLWLLGRGLSASYPDWLAAAFPTLPITYLPCDHVDYGKVSRIPGRITISTMDRLLLPHLLEDVQRVVYLDVDTLVRGDVTELARVDLGDSAVAAVDSNVSEVSEWRAAARRLPLAHAKELERRMAAAHGYGAPALNAGVLVLDLDRMRREDFTRTYLAWVARYSLHDQDVMLAYAGPQRRHLDPQWNAMPVLADVPDARIVHWASLAKPWDTPLTVAQEEWQQVASRLRARVPGPPPAALPAPVDVGAVQAPLGPRLEQVIGGVRRENLRRRRDLGDTM